MEENAEDCLRRGGKDGSLPAARHQSPEKLPPQHNLYRLYHEIHGTAVHNLPALLPEVWLHWDPKTVRERGPEALLRFRMDFLLLLPHGHRIIIEVDGNRHYTGSDGLSSPANYGNNVCGDRDLKLAGYEVFRFGGAELNRPVTARARCSSSSSLTSFAATA